MFARSPVSQSETTCDHRSAQMTQHLKIGRPGTVGISTGKSVMHSCGQLGDRCRKLPTRGRPLPCLSALAAKVTATHLTREDEKRRPQDFTAHTWCLLPMTCAAAFYTAWSVGRPADSRSHKKDRFRRDYSTAATPFLDPLQRYVCGASSTEPP